MKLITTLLFALILLTPAVNAFAATPIRVFVDGEEVEFPDQEPYIDSNSRTLVPVRFPSEAFGADVEWDGADRRVDIEHEERGKFVELWIGQRGYNVNSEERKMDTEAVITNSRTMVPVRFVGEALGIDVRWEVHAGTGIVHNFTLDQSEEEIQ